MRRLLWILLFLGCFFSAGVTAYAEESKRYKDLYEQGVLHIGTENGNEYFKKAVAENPNFAPPLYWLGFESCRMGNDLEAIGYFQRYIAVAQGKEEKARIATAKAVLKELKSGKSGDEIKKIRMDQP